MSMRISGTWSVPDIFSFFLFRMFLTRQSADMPVLLQQHQDEHEQPVPRMPKTLRRQINPMESRHAGRVCCYRYNKSFMVHADILTESPNSGPTSQRTRKKEWLNNVRKRSRNGRLSERIAKISLASGLSRRTWST